FLISAVDGRFLFLDQFPDGIRRLRTRGGCLRRRHGNRQNQQHQKGEQCTFHEQTRPSHSQNRSAFPPRTHFSIDTNVRQGEDDHTPQPKRRSLHAPPFSSFKDLKGI